MPLWFWQSVCTLKRFQINRRIFKPSACRLHKMIAHAHEAYVTLQKVPGITALDVNLNEVIPLCTSGNRCLGYLLSHLIKTDTLETDLITTLMKGFKHESNDIKQMIGQIVSFIMSGLTQPLNPPVCKMMVPPLVIGTKEKNTVVRTNSEYALVALLLLRKGDSYFKTVISMLDTGMQDSVQEVFSKSLKKIINQPEPLADQMDDTILT